MEPQTLQTIVAWSGGTLLSGDPAARTTGISIDSRSVRPGELFLALPGKRCDGHDYAAEALSRQAAGVIISRPVPEIGRWPAGGALIRTADSFRALAGLARGYRALFDLTAVAVTGSNGKTTTKDLIARLLNARMETLAAPASYNNLVGLSLTILRLEKRHRAVVFELGMNRPGEIRELADICRPGAGVITNVGLAHIGYFGSVDEIAAEKEALLGGLTGEKAAFLNVDDRRVAAMAGSARGPVIGFGFGPSARIRASDPQLLPDGARFRVALSGGELTIDSPLPGRHNLYNLLAALAVADHCGVPPETIRETVRTAALPPRRLEKVRVGEATVINDAYNANPASMRAALEAWLGMESGGRRIMVSGDMNELGTFSVAEHRAWGAVLGGAGLDRLIFVGPRSRDAAAAAVDRGFPGKKVHAVGDCRAAAAVLRDVIRPRDSILIKGSRVMEMEEIVEELTNNTKSKAQNADVDAACTASERNNGVLE
ncbi:MAG: UDP-N-acetylmuramoyl-tripeptide--D-alanyl-D-alanine ligase [PVC group bacterium]